MSKADIEKYNMYHSRFHRKRAMTAEQFNAFESTALDYIRPEALLAYNKARLKSGRGVDIRKFLPSDEDAGIEDLMASIDTLIKEHDVAAALPVDASLGENHVVDCSCSDCSLGENHVVDCSCSDCSLDQAVAPTNDVSVENLLEGMTAPIVKVVPKVSFVQVWTAFAKNKHKTSLTSADIKSMAFIQKSPPLGFDIDDQSMVDRFINSNAFKKQQLHDETIEFLDGHVEKGDELREKIRGLEAMDIQSLTSPLVVELKF